MCATINRFNAPGTVKYHCDLQVNSIRGSRQPRKLLKMNFMIVVMHLDAFSMMVFEELWPGCFREQAVQH